MKRIVVCSDVHGFYDELMNALNEINFNPETDLFISLGDNIDRGPKPKEVIEFMLSLPNKILVRGNHCILFEDFCKRGYPLFYDWNNGTANSIMDLAPKARNWEAACLIAMEKMTPMLDQMINYFETERYIFCHSWIASGKDWRYASQSKWNKAMWGNPFDIAAVVGNKTGKTIVHGHFHNSYGWTAKGIGSEFGDDAKFDICEHDGCIGLDTCTAHTHKVNILVLEDKFLEEE